jgi:hypothetical protein
MAKKITLRDGVDPDAAMAAVASAAERSGFTLERTDVAAATAHDGDTPVTGNATATRARVDVRVTPGRIELRSTTTGAAYAGAAGVGFFTARINWRTSRFAKAVKRAVADAGLS